MEPHERGPQSAGADIEDDFPRISTVDRGFRITRLVPGREVGRLDGSVWLRLVVCACLWSLVASVPFVALLGLAPTPALEAALGSPWALVTAIVVAVIAIHQTVRLAETVRVRFGQASVGGRVAGLVVAGGFALSGIVWLAATRLTASVPFDLGRIATADRIPAELGAVVVAAATACALWYAARFVRGVSHARSRQQTIAALRATGRRHVGSLAERTFSNLWLLDNPCFRIRVEYPAADGVRSVAARMITTADRVPEVGSRMIVLTDDAGNTHVEIDATASFETDSRAFVAPEG